MSNVYGVAHFAKQNAVPQVEWKNIDIIGQYIDNLNKQKQLEMMDKSYELAKDQAAFAREKFLEDVRQFELKRNTLSAKEQVDLDFKNREWNEMTPYQKAQLEVERSKVNALRASSGGNQQIQRNTDVESWILSNKGNKNIVVALANSPYKNYDGLEKAFRSGDLQSYMDALVYAKNLMLQANK